MTRTKNPALSPAACGLTAQDAARIVRLHDMCKDMDEDAFEQMETAAASIKLVASLKRMDPRPGGAA